MAEIGTGVACKSVFLVLPSLKFRVSDWVNVEKYFIFSRVTMYVVQSLFPISITQVFQVSTYLEIKAIFVMLSNKAKRV